MNEKITEARKLIRSGEGQYVEFKKKVNHPEKIVREVVAFANSSGGNLLIGVDDNGIISGLKYPDEEEYLMSKSIEELCRPKVAYTVDFLKIKTDVEILHYRIEESNKKPHFAFLEKKHRYGKAYYRIGDQSIQATYELRQILKRKSRSHPPIVFEDKTRALFKYFENKPFITLEEYQQISGLNKKIASDKLIHLTLSGALKILPQEGGDIFLPAE